MGVAVSGRADGIRVGVIGAGAMGAAHIRTLARWVPSATVVAAYDADVSRATAICAEVGARVADGSGELITADDVDAVLIAAPDPLHEELVLSCLAAEKPTLCEKPLATSAESSLRVVDAEVAAGRRLVQVGFMRRHDQAYEQLRQMISTGGVGDVRVVHCVHRNPRAHPTATSEGIITNSMIHELDIVPWLLDDAWSAVTMTVPRLDDGQLLDPQVGVLETRSGVVVTSEVFVNARYGYDVRCEVVGAAGTARLSAPYGLGLRRDGVDGMVVAPDFVERFADAYRVELEEWVTAAAGGASGGGSAGGAGAGAGGGAGGAGGASAWDAYRADLAAAAAVESLHCGARVAISDPEPPALYATTPADG